MLLYKQQIVDYYSVKEHLDCRLILIRKMGVAVVF
ncbi:hypothetical protein J2S00_001593 [Caldalkalibacillus uzonensis]|uniref:Uncharacterized protein n=1 Tax=Caldalkalibacillus uzonensis TaxID=353224 RepID=A0ABU0CUV9_9BACI|nr:hypothetical protein [Caldalkalibacillus uzonensis]